MKLMILKQENIFKRPGLFTLCCVGLIAFVAIIAATAFFLTVRGAEQTMVPDIQGKSLIEALLELQQKELYPRIELRYSASAADKGLILEQEPRAGSIVKAGRRIRLVISQGAAISVVENYVGRGIDDVRIELQTMFASNPQPLITLKDPILYQYSSKPAGVVLEQSPASGANIFSPIELELIVSRGEEDILLETPDFIGLSVDKAVEKASNSGIRFNFSTRMGQSRRNAETVVAQTPEAGLKIDSGDVVELVVATPARIDLDENEVFSLFKYTLPENPYPLPATLEVILPGGERKVLAALKHSGGDFTFPYRLPSGSVIILSLLNREMYRETVR
ncbi:MAG: PASTA domain-containing protein [Spirochaetaceae bacterium]|jgi:beta-lactam-binding protein with PASTA domain|nr:PASTA domain-containing protein [Spirochaetaceae bacterium]